MGVTVRAYDSDSDYERISRFLIDTYEPTDRLRNWLQPRWEYMHHHPLISNVPLERIAVFEHDGRIVGVAHPEDKPAFIHFQRAPGYDHILPGMFAHASDHFGGESIMPQRRTIGLFINEFDTELETLAASFGYQRLAGVHDGYSKFDLTMPVPPAPIPPEFRLQSLAVANDQRKINTCLWRGFEHDGDISEEAASQPAVAQHAPNFCKSQTIVAVAPDGEYVSYAGVWYVPENGFAYVEPVATDPHFRRLGLGKACVLETLRRVRMRGAQLAWVGSDQEFYRAIGFETKFRRNLWVKHLDRN